MSSKNPVLKNITDYLIEEASAEEEELLGMSGDQEEGQLGGDGDGPIERDPTLVKVQVNLIDAVLSMRYLLFEKLLTICQSILDFRSIEFYVSKRTKTQMVNK